MYTCCLPVLFQEKWTNSREKPMKSGKPQVKGWWITKRRRLRRHKMSVLRGWLCSNSFVMVYLIIEQEAVAVYNRSKIPIISILLVSITASEGLARDKCKLHVLIDKWTPSFMQSQKIVLIADDLCRLLLPPNISRRERVKWGEQTHLHSTVRGKFVEGMPLTSIIILDWLGTGS